ncbi:MAG: dihydrofolate reductase family protein, partial [Nocardiopsaceae bacterium]|nr:dihydrofolate reductase family protein [Nocardiopsaceae bacterium]
MNKRPYVLLSCAVSVDGCLDAPGPQRLILSGDADLDRVDAERSGCDAIMVGAGTIRRDNPRLLIRSPARRAARAARGLPGHPAAVTLTASGDLDPAACFFTAGQSAAGAGTGAGAGTVAPAAGTVAGAGAAAGA